VRSSSAALVGELASMPGIAPHEARFIVEEAAGAPEAARRMAARRAGGEPLQYVFGHWPFRSLDLLVDRRVLIPRPETEQVVEVALAEARRLRARGVVAVDAGTGSGAIALSLVTELDDARVWATDVSADALAVAACNAARVQQARVQAGAGHAQVELAEGSWLDPLPAALRGRVDLVVSNPPYVSEAEWAALATEVRAEPRLALVAGAAGDGTPGLADVEAVLAEARAWLARPGAVVVELAPHQASAATALARELGYDDVRVDPDLSGRDRALVARTGAS
jgi:release factor glutamine methyltransferase